MLVQKKKRIVKNETCTKTTVCNEKYLAKVTNNLGGLKTDMGENCKYSVLKSNINF